MTIRLAVIVSDCAAAANVGGGIGTSVRTFDLPVPVADYIARQRNSQWTTVTLAVEVSDEPS